MKTFIRRPGNKSKFLKHIIPEIPEFTGRYIECFAGTGALFLSLLPNNANINDLHPDIIGIWNLVKDEPQFIIDEINKVKKYLLPLSNQDKLKFCKSLHRNIGAGKFRTVNYLILNNCSYNGMIDKRFSSLYPELCKRNTCYLFTDKYSRNILSLSKILNEGNINIGNYDYREVLQYACKDDFVFLDSPYIESKSYDFEYIKDNVFDVNELKNEVDKLTSRGVKFLMTQIDTKQVRELFQEYNFKEYTNKNSLYGKGHGKCEVIITNF